MLSKPEEEAIDKVEETGHQTIDSKYRLIILAAKRSKQIQRGARPRVKLDLQKHKATRIALEEIYRDQVRFTIEDEENKLRPAAD